jgi:hypothetical protein
MATPFLMAGVRKEVEFLGLPGVKTFTVIVDAHTPPRCVHLLRKYSRITRYIEGFGGHHGRRLVVAVVLSSHVAGHPGDDDLRPGQTNDTHYLIQRRPMPQRFERMQHVLRGRIGPMEEPDVADAAYR